LRQRNCGFLCLSQCVTWPLCRGRQLRSSGLCASRLTSCLKGCVPRVLQAVCLTRCVPRVLQASFPPPCILAHQDTHESKDTHVNTHTHIKTHTHADTDIYAHLDTKVDTWLLATTTPACDDVEEPAAMVATAAIHRCTLAAP